MNMIRRWCGFSINLKDRGEKEFLLGWYFDQNGNYYEKDGKCILCNNQKYKAVQAVSNDNKVYYNQTKDGLKKHYGKFTHLTGSSYGRSIESQSEELCFNCDIILVLANEELKKLWL